MPSTPEELRRQLSSEMGLDFLPDEDVGSDESVLFFTPDERAHTPVSGYPVSPPRILDAHWALQPGQGWVFQADDTSGHMPIDPGSNFLNDHSESEFSAPQVPLHLPWCCYLITDANSHTASLTGPLCPVPPMMRSRAAR